MKLWKQTTATLYGKQSRMLIIKSVKKALLSIVTYGGFFFQRGGKPIAIQYKEKENWLINALGMPLPILSQRRKAIINFSK